MYKLYVWGGVLCQNKCAEVSRQLGVSSLSSQSGSQGLSASTVFYLSFFPKPLIFGNLIDSVTLFLITEWHFSMWWHSATDCRKGAVTMWQSYLPAQKRGRELWSRPLPLLSILRFELVTHHVGAVYLCLCGVHPLSSFSILSSILLLKLPNQRVFRWFHLPQNLPGLPKTCKHSQNFQRVLRGLLIVPHLLIFTLCTEFKPLQDGLQAPKPLLCTLYYLK